MKTSKRVVHVSALS